MTRRHTLPLSLIDPAAVAFRAVLSDRISAIYADGETSTAYALADGPSTLWAATRETVQEACVQCHALHDAVWTVYSINGARTILPGGGIPLTVPKLPRDAMRLDPAAAAAFWHAP
jgi:hypothetical protein